MRDERVISIIRRVAGALAADASEERIRQVVEEEREAVSDCLVSSHQERGTASVVELGFAEGWRPLLSEVSRALGPYGPVPKMHPFDKPKVSFDVRDPSGAFDTVVSAQVESGARGVEDGRVCVAKVIQRSKFLPLEPSDDYKRLVESVDGASKGGPDLLALGRLTGVEREQAEDLLVARMGLGDWRVPEALIAMKASPAGALQGLRYVRRTVGERRFRVAVARALKVLCNNDEGLDDVLSCLKEGDEEVRAYAAIVARHFDHDRVGEPLLDAATGDPAPSVREAALESILGLLGFPLIQRSWRSLTGLLLELARMDASVMRTRTSELLDVLIGKLQSGVTRESLDAEVDAGVEAAVLSGNADHLSQLRGVARDWADWALMVR